MASLKEEFVFDLSKFDEIDILETKQSKFDLAMAFHDMGDLEAAKSILDGIGFSTTPNKIAKLIEIIASIYKPNSVIDICCGYGNILSHFEHLQNVKGIEIDDDVIQLAKHINSNIDFIVADTLKYDFGNTKYDLVVGNLPFDKKSSNCQEFRELFSECRPNCKILDIDLMEKGLSLLNKNGIAIFIVPENLFLASSNWENKILSNFHRELLANFALDMVISLPSGTFPAYAGITKTSVLVIRNGDKKQDVFMPEFKDNPFEIADNFRQHKGDFYFPISKFTNKLDRNYYLSLEIIEKTLNGCEVKKLNDIAEIISGKQLKKDSFKIDGKYLVFNRRDNEGNNFVDNISNKECVLQSDDIVICLNGQNNKIYFYKDDGIKTVIKDGYAIIRSKDNSKYTTTYFQTENGIDILKKQISLNLIGAAMPHLPVSNLRNFNIPIIEFSNSEKVFSKLVSKSFELTNKKERFLIKSSIYLFLSSESLGKNEYDLARDYVDLAFELADKEDKRHKDSYLQNIDRAEELEEKNQQLKQANAQLKAKEKELEDMMSMFAHKFRSPLDAILYNTTHENQIKLYAESAQTMRGLLDIFSIISADDKILTDKIKNDKQGNARLSSVFSKVLDMTLLHLLSVSGMGKIHQHYLNYAKTQGKISSDVSYKTWCDDYFDLEGELQNQWEQEFSALLNQSASLEQRLNWLEQYFFKLELVGFDNDTIQFKEYEATESFLFILMNEILVNAFKYYASENRQPVVLEWTANADYQILTCRNPSVSFERKQLKGSGKGHSFLSALARKTGSQFTKPKPQDDFVLEFAILNALLL